MGLPKLGCLAPSFKLLNQNTEEIELKSPRTQLLWTINSKAQLYQRLHHGPALLCFRIEEDNNEADQLSSKKIR